MSNIRGAFGVRDIKRSEKMYPQIEKEIKKICSKYGEPISFYAVQRYFNKRRTEINNKKEIAKLEKELKELRTK